MGAYWCGIFGIESRDMLSIRAYQHEKRPTCFDMSQIPQPSLSESGGERFTITPLLW